MEHVAVGWLVFDITGSAFMVGVAAAARMAPLFFLGILSGAMADWLERRLFLFFSALGGVLVSSVMASILLLGFLRRGPSLSWLLPEAAFSRLPSPLGTPIHTT